MLPTCAIQLPRKVRQLDALLSDKYLRAKIVLNRKQKKEKKILRKYVLRKICCELCSGEMSAQADMNKTQLSTVSASNQRRFTRSAHARRSNLRKLCSALSRFHLNSFA